MVAVGEREFYATNDHGFARDSIIHKLSFLVNSLSFSSLVHWDGHTVSYPLDSYSPAFGNGVTVSKDGQFIYLADTEKQTISMFSISNNESEKLKLVRTVHTGTGVDNIDVDENETLFVACHPNLLRFVTHMLGGNSTPAPSQVIKIDLHNLQKSPAVEEIYLSNGSNKNDLSASSTAIHIGNYLLITPVFDDHLLLCHK